MENYGLSKQSWSSEFLELPNGIPSNDTFRFVLCNRPRSNIISRLKVFLVKKSIRIKIILIASYFFSKIELETIDIHFGYRTIYLVHRSKASYDWVIIFGDVYLVFPGTVNNSGACT